MTSAILLYIVIFSAGLLVVTFGAIIWVTGEWERIAEQMRSRVAARVARPIQTVKDKARVTRELIWGRAHLGR